MFETGATEERLNRMSVARDSELPVKDENFEKLKFTGSASGYFKIWIVNLLLTILTLGIYSAWAKVRRTKYFYNHTWLKDENFDFTGNPLKILYGRIFVILLYAAFLFLNSSETLPLKSAALVLFLVAIPYIVIKSRAFRLRNTTYAGLRFSYKATYQEAAKVLAVYPFFAAITFGFLKPFELRKRGNLFVDRSSYGGKHFEFAANKTDFASIVLSTFLLSLLCLVLVVAPIALAKFFQNEALVPFIFVGIFALYYLVGRYFFVCRNEYINHTSFAGAQLQSTLKPRAIIWIYISNILLVVCSLGLLIPYTKVRLHRYKVENLAVSGLNLDRIKADLTADQSSLGEEVNDFLDFDFGI